MENILRDYKNYEDIEKKWDQKQFSDLSDHALEDDTDLQDFFLGPTKGEC